MNLWPFRNRSGVYVGSGDFMEVNYPGLRSPSTLENQEINLVYSYGGIGDYIYWTTVMDWIFSEHPHLFGSVVAPSYFYELASHWLSHLSPRVKVRSYEKIDKDKFLRRGDKFFIIPNGQQLVNSCGAHLLDIGFRYYANLDTIPDGYERMPQISGVERDISRFGLPENYVVVTTEATSPIRKLKAETINGICDWLRVFDYKPVFLGRRELAHDYHATADDGVILEGVLDLREKTGLLEAACVLAGAKAVVGLDNGLLHLACCSRVPVVMGFNTVDPRQRVPVRSKELKTIAVMPGESLECRFCQSRVRFVLGHNFHKCLYGDAKCLDHLNAEVFIKGLIKVLE